MTVGESAVGKSSITLRFVHNHFKENNVATIGASFVSRTMDLNRGQYVKFNIWDTAGQEKYRSLASLYYRGVDCAIVVYDISQRVCLGVTNSISVLCLIYLFFSSKDSFEAVRSYWMNELSLQCGDYSDLLIVLAGNKCDLDDLRVSKNEFYLVSL